MNTEVKGLRLTIKHIRSVQGNMRHIIDKLLHRMVVHDMTKFTQAELPLILGKAKLDELEYNSPEYQDALAEKSEALDHHYRLNLHHPNPIESMTLLDLLEMLADWKAAGDDIYESLEINRKRFNISDELYEILLNTINELE